MPVTPQTPPRLVVALTGATGIVYGVRPLYYRPKTLDDVVNHTVARVLDRLGVPHALTEEWRGTVGRRGEGSP